MPRRTSTRTDPIRNPGDKVALWLSVIGGLFVAIVIVMGDYFAAKFPQSSEITHEVILAVLFVLLVLSLFIYRRAAQERDGLRQQRSLLEERRTFWYQVAQVLAVLSGGLFVAAGIFSTLATNVLSVNADLTSIELQAVSMKAQFDLSNSSLEIVDARQNDVQAAQGIVVPIVRNAMLAANGFLYGGFALALAALTACVWAYYQR